MIRPPQEYHADGPFTLVIFDRRYPGVAERFRSEWEAWREVAEVEYLSLDHAVLLIRPGGARRLGTWMRDRREGAM